MEESALWSSNWDPKVYNLLEKIVFMRGGVSLVFFLLDFAKIRQSFLLFYCKPAKNNQQTLIEYAQKHFKSALGKLPKSVEKILNKKLKWTK